MACTRRSFLRLTGAGLAGLSVASRAAAAAVAGSPRNRLTVEHALATLQDGSEFATPYWRVDSGRDGPSLVLLAAQHGNEVVGSEVARRFSEACAEHLLAGTVWLVPRANLLAVRSRRHSVGLGPEQNNRLSTRVHNMQRAWPGNPRGNDTERVAHALDQAVLRHCSHIVDMHCWEHVKAGETLAFDNHPASRALGEVTTTRFVSFRPVSVPQTGPLMAAQLALQRGGAALVMELSGQFQMPQRQIATGYTSMLNVARLLGMFAGAPEPAPAPRIVKTKEASHDVRAPCSGMFVPARTRDGTADLGPEDHVLAGQPLGHIIRERDLVRVPVTAPVSGYLWQYGLCHWNLCDASLPALHPYADEREVIAIVVKA